MERANPNTGISLPATIGYIIHFIPTGSSFLQIFLFPSSIHMSSSSNRHGITVARFFSPVEAPDGTSACPTHRLLACTECCVASRASSRAIDPRLMGCKKQSKTKTPASMERFVTEPPARAYNPVRQNERGAPPTYIFGQRVRPLLPLPNHATIRPQ